MVAQMDNPARPEPVQAVLHKSTSLTRLARECARRAELLRQVQACLPGPLAEQLCAASLANGQLSLTVFSAAWASRLRLAAPTLIDALASQQAVACERVVVRVRPSATLPADPG
jgi:hypothetical protein